MSDSFHRSLDAALARQEDPIPEPHMCTAIVHPAYMSNEAVYCDNEAAPGFTECDTHLDPHDWGDAARQALLDYFTKGVE